MGEVGSSRLLTAARSAKGRTSVRPGGRSSYLEARMLLIAVAVIIQFILSTRAMCQQDAASIRAAYLFNILKYVNWPSSQTEIRVALIADERTSSVFFNVTNQKTIAGKEIRVFKSPSDAEIDSADVIYVQQGSPANSHRVLERLARRENRAVLTIGETEQFLKEGGMISLSRSLDQIQLEVNLDETQGSPLRLSSGLLNIAVLRRFGRLNK